MTPRDLLRRLQRLTRATRNPSPRSAEASAVAARTAPWRPPDRVASPRPWYGWWLLAAATAAITLQSGVYVFGFGVFFLPIVAEFGWSRAAASGAVSLARLENGLTGPLEGWLIDRWGPRRVMLVGIPLLALGFLALSRVDSLLGYYVVYVGMLSLGSSLGFFNPCSAAVANWFVRRRAFALGLMSCGIGCGTVLVPAVAWLVEGLGWRSAALVLGAATLAIGLPLATAIRHRPEPYGERPDGAPPGADPPVPRRELAVGARQALRMPEFWILSVLFAVRLMVTTAVSLHLIPLVTDTGLGIQAAALMTTVLGVLSIAGRLCFGWLGDRWGSKPTYALGLVALVVGLVVLANARSLEVVLLALLFYAPAYGGLAALMLSLRGEYFGRRSFATIGGLMAPVMTLGTLTGPVFAGWVFDTTGSYRPAMYAFAALTVLALLCLMPLRRSPSHRVD